MHNLEIHNLTVCGCGVLSNIDRDAEHNIKASITIQYSINLTISGVTITSSPGTGLALFYNNGSISVERSSFERNGLDRHTGGNGVYIETGPSVSVVPDLVSNYTFSHCNFLFNAAVTGKDSIIKGFSRFDKGGGMCIYILGSEKHNVTLSYSRFHGNQVDHYGGGLSISYIGKSRNNNVMVSQCEFFNNSATFGGASYSGYLHTRVPLETPLNCSYYYESVTFIENSGQFGGGSSIFASQTLTNDSSAEVNFKNCSWLRNFGQYGAAVAVLPNAWNLYAEGYLPTPRFIECSISSNEAKPRNILQKGVYNEYSKGSGAFYCYRHNVLFEENTLFMNNVGSAMYLGSCLALFHKDSVTYFLNNTGYQGGAIYQLSSVVYIHDNASLTFANNSADDKGGAIYEHTFFMHIYDYSKTCFIDYMDDIKDVVKRNISVTFIHNFAGRYGHSIYASSLRPCYNRFSFSASNLSVDIFNQVGNFTYIPTDRPMEIATAVNHSNITDSYWSENLSFIPGKNMRIPFIDIDDLDQQIMTNYLVTIQSKSNISTSNDYTEISNNMLLLYGKGGENATVTLSDTSSRQIALSFKITMQPCPPGFIHDDESQGCVCSMNSYIGTENCNLTCMRALSKEGYWNGYKANETENEDSFISGYCPRGFCNSTGSDDHLLPEKADREELSDIMCVESRTGVLCGQCKENFSVHYHSLEFACKSDELCYLGWLFYILSEIVPVTIIFLVIMFFNISFTSGLVNGFIFYCQVVEVFHFISNGLIPFSEAAQVMNKIHSFIYLSFTLNLFVLDEISFCLWKSASAISIVAFKYVTLLYAFALIVIITILIEKCSIDNLRFRFSGYRPLQSKRSSQSRGNIIHGLTAFLILCYAQCARSSLLLLVSVTLYSKGPIKYKSTVYYDGDIEWMSIEHLPYAIPAILLALIVLILPPTLLLIYPLHNKLLSVLKISEFKCVQIVFSPLDKLKPLFDSFQGCFKDEFRFFSGLYFVYRFFIMFNVVINYSQDSFFFLELQLVIMLVLHALCQPYKKRLHNIIDTLLFGNLIVINAITYYNISSSGPGSNTTVVNLSASTWIQIVLTFLPLPLVFLLVLAHTRCVHKCCGKTYVSNSINDYNPDELPDRMFSSKENVNDKLSV